MSNYEILLIVAGIMLGVSAIFSYRTISNILFVLKVKSSYKKKLKEKEDAVKKYKEDGNLHKWVTLPVKFPDGKLQETQICEETGYCPAINGYVELSQVKNMLEMRKTEEEYQEFRKSELKRIQEYYSIDNSDIEPLVADIFGMKKKFHVQKMEESIADLKQKFPNMRVITDINELPGIIDEINKEKNS